MAVNSIYASIIPSYKYNLVLKSFSYGTQVMGHPVCNTLGNAILCNSCDFAGSRCARPANIPIVTQNNAFPNWLHK
jgi:hypothetical protein